MQSDGRMKAAVRRARTGGGMKLDTNSLSDTFSEQYLSVFQVTVCIVLFYSELKKHLDVFQNSVQLHVELCCLMNDYSQT